MGAESAIRCLLLSLLLISGCATFQPKFEVSVDSIARATADKKSYLLLPGSEDITADTRRFEEYASYVHRALKKQGFVPAESFEEANVAIYLSYGIGDPRQHRYSYSIRTWDQTGVPAHTAGAVDFPAGYGPYSGTRISTLGYGIPEATSHLVTYTTYSRYLILDAVALRGNRKTKKGARLWETTVKSTGSSSDLRRVFPILVAASRPYIGTNTGKEVEVALFEDEQEVAAIKGFAEGRIN